MPTPTIQDRIDAILRARDSGLSETTVEGVTVRWRNLDELERILTSLRTEQAATSGTPPTEVLIIRPNLVSGIW